jgi:hypothetical protein
VLPVAAAPYPGGRHPQKDRDGTGLAPHRHSSPQATKSHDLSRLYDEQL